MVTVVDECPRWSWTAFGVPGQGIAIWPVNDKKTGIDEPLEAVGSLQLPEDHN